MFVHSVTLFTPVNRKSLILLARLRNLTVVSVVKNKFCHLVICHRFKKALFISAFFIAQLFSLPLEAADCPSFKAIESAHIRYVHDGDTVILQDQRKVRLIGIDTPELARNDSPEQPYAIQARDYVRELLHQHGSLVRLMPGQEKQDRYGRQLYHIELANGELIQSALLKAGLAIAFTTPPNQKLSHCYQQAEQQAASKKRHIWSHPKYQAIQARDILPSTEGFHIVQARARHIGESKKAYWINFDDNFSARIDKRDLHFFKDQPLEQLIGKQLQIRGWIRHYKNKAQVTLRHPSALRLINP